MPSISPPPETDFAAAGSDAELLARWNRGDEAAFTMLFRRHAGRIYHVALRRGAAPRAAEEIVQHVMTATARKASALETAGNLPGWLHRAALLELRRLRRTEAREARRRESLAVLSIMQTVPPSPAPDETVLQAEIDGALIRLSNKEQAYVFQRFYEGRSVREIAAGTGESEAAVQKRGHRALERLASLLSRRTAPVSVPVVMALISRGLQSPAPASLLLHGPAASLKAAAVASGWWAALARWRWPAVKVATACIFLGAAVWQEQFIEAPRAAATATLSPARQSGPTGNGGALTARNFQTPVSAFDLNEPDLAALAEFCYRDELGAADRTMSSKLFFQIGDWFGPHRHGKGLALLEKLYTIDIPTTHRRALAARLLGYDWVETQAKLEWTLRFHTKDDPPGEWHDSFTRSIVIALSRWAKEDPAAAWQWMQQQPASGSLHEAKGDRHDYASGPLEEGLARLFVIASEEGNASLAAEILAGMNARERGAALGSRLKSLPVDSPDIMWCLEQIAALPGPRLQRVAWQEAQGWLRLRDIPPQRAAELVTRLSANWTAPPETKVQFISNMAPQETGPGLAYHRLVLHEAGSDVAAALAARAGRDSSAAEIAGLMPVAVERGCWQEMARAVKERACTIPSSAGEVSRLATLLPLIPDNAVRAAFVSEWNESAARNKVTREVLLKNGMTPQDLNVLMPEPAAP